jgi:hypothetical protein
MHQVLYILHLLVLWKSLSLSSVIARWLGLLQVDEAHIDNPVDGVSYKIKDLYNILSKALYNNYMGTL